jgi:DNA topoisomerase-1
VPLLQRFWDPFNALVQEKTESVDRSDATGARELGIDPVSGKPVNVRLGRYGAFSPRSLPCARRKTGGVT